jgi:HEAT repeat protein
MRNLLLSTLLIGLCSLPALAHGGQYKGPSDAGGPSGGAGANSAPPTNPGGAAAPGPGAPASGGPSTGANTSGGTTRGGSSRKGASTGGGEIDFDMSYETWEFWWENNKDAYLNLKDRLAQTNSATGSSGHLTGRGRRSVANSSRRPSTEQIETLLPMLAELMRTSDNRDIMDSAVLAMARAAREQSADQVLAAAVPLIGHNELSVQTASTLALGVLGSPKAVPTLKDLVADTSKGRQIAGGRGEVEWLVRSFAALSLGLVNDTGSVETLIDLVKNTPDSDKDLKVGSIVALGLMENPKSPDAVRFLTELLDDRKLDAVIKSYVPTSLAKLTSRMDNADPAVLTALINTFSDRDTDNYVRQSAAIALGLLADASQKDATDPLFDYIAEGKDVQTRHFCFISLAQIGARDLQSQANQAFHEKVTSLFEKQITKPDPTTNRPWAALSAAIYAQKQDGAKASIADRLVDGYKGEKNPSFRSAFAIAIGLMHLTGQGEMIYKDYSESKEPEFKGYAAVALGFLTYTDASETLNAQCQLKSITPTYRLQVATGLGLMGDLEAVTTLTETLKDAQTLGVSSAVAKALGLIGDRSAVEPLSQIARDSKVQTITRAFACVALGLVCEKTDLPWNARISADNNYRAGVPAINEVLDIL